MTTEMKHAQDLFNALEQASRNQYPKGCVQLTIRNLSTLRVRCVHATLWDEDGPVWEVTAITQNGYRRYFMICLTNAQDFQLSIDATCTIRRRVSKDPNAYFMRKVI